ncbi:MAG: rod shape-determining protein MreD [Bacteroidaceae bacterium]|nr:rod shape-determining protein MreD [Bacteroidaceae bacterium]
MIYDIVNKAFWFVGLILLQVLLFDKMTIAGVATPLPYIYLLISWNRDTSRWSLLLTGFFLGFIIDIFTNLPGVNASACTLLAMMQPVYLNLFIPRESQDEYALVPSITSLKWIGFLKYLVFCVLTHHLVVISLVFFSLNDVLGVILRVLGCALLTIFIILIFELLRRKQRT